MIQLALNYSEEAASLVSKDRIDIDRFKTPDWPDMIANAGTLRPVAVHFNLNAGSLRFADTDWARCEALLKQTNTPFLNLHLNAELTDFPGIPVHTPQKRQYKVVADQLIADVAAAVERFGPERVIVENVPYRGSFETTLRPSVEASLIRRIIQTTGCGLLLDLSHARISACYLGVDEFEYLSALPVQNLREMHFTGLRWLNGKLKDHHPALPVDWRMLRWALDRIQGGEWSTPWLLAFEYGGVGDKFKGRSEREVMLEQLPMLNNLIRMT